MNIIISLFIGAVVGFIVCFLCFKNNVEWFTRLAGIFKDDKGSVPVSPVGANTLIKYLLRFGIPLAGIVGLVALLNTEMVPVMLYKGCLILAGFILAEFIWVVGYKYIFGKIEKEGISEGDRRSILIFRGILYASVILGLTLGM